MIRKGIMVFMEYKLKVNSHEKPIEEILDEIKRIEDTGVSVGDLWVTCGIQALEKLKSVATSINSSNGAPRIDTLLTIQGRICGIKLHQIEEAIFFEFAWITDAAMPACGTMAYLSKLIENKSVEDILLIEVE